MNCSILAIASFLVLVAVGTNGDSIDAKYDGNKQPVNIDNILSTMKSAARQFCNNRSKHDDFNLTGDIDKAITKVKKLNIGARSGDITGILNDMKTHLAQRTPLKYAESEEEEEEEA